MINKLERQLQEERTERERMRYEIEELKKINAKLAQSIMGSSNGSVAAVKKAPATKKQ
jgi:predicted RNase H-like nuclease (RuvC/YqgF family)